MLKSCKHCRDYEKKKRKKSCSWTATLQHCSLSQRFLLNGRNIHLLHSPFIESVWPRQQERERKTKNWSRAGMGVGSWESYGHVKQLVQWLLTALLCILMPPSQRPRNEVRRRRDKYESLSENAWRLENSVNLNRDRAGWQSIFGGQRREDRTDKDCPR